MKMVIAIVQDKDVGKLLQGVTREGLSATRLASSGGVSEVRKYNVAFWCRRATVGYPPSDYSRDMSSTRRDVDADTVNYGACERSYTLSNRGSGGWSHNICPRC